MLKAKGVGFSYSSEKGKLPILSGLDLCVEEGEFLSILGPSGCGKSTLLRLLSGFILPKEGVITLRDRKVKGPSPEGQMIFQDPAQLLPWMTVEGNIRLSSTGDPPIMEELLSLTGLLSYRKFFPHQLSGGLKQRTALARALYANPSLLFMDEPFGSLDAPARRGLQQLLLKVWKTRQVTILFVSHDIGETLLLSDRILIFPGDGGAPFIQKNPLPRPRDSSEEAFRRKQVRLYSLVDSL